MREIKLYPRKKRVDPEVHALRDAEVIHMTLNHVRALENACEKWRTTAPS